MMTTGPRESLMEGSGQVLVPVPEATAGDWFVLHTKSRCEKVLAGEMEALSIPHYLPLLARVKFYGRRKAVVNEPIFPGYVFLRGTVDNAYEAARTKRIAKILRVADQQQIDWELRNLAMALLTGADLDPYPALREGVRVEVASGPFRGIQGIIESRLRCDRLILQVEMLGRAVSLEIDGALLNPL